MNRYRVKGEAVLVDLINARIHDRILAKKKSLDALRPLPPSIVRKLQHQMEVEYVYNSNAIEGNTLTLRETQLILEEGVTVNGRSLREHVEARNHPRALEYITKLTRQELSEHNIFVLHQLIMKRIDDQAGRYRMGEVRIAGANFIPPPAYEIPHLMSDMLNWYNQNPDELRPIELASLLHHKFVYIHPFRDGNGRIARLLMNLHLLRHGYPVVTILNIDRKKYYDRLKRADNDDLEPLVNFVATAVERSLDLYLRSVKPTAKEDRLISLAEASKGTPYDQEYLSLLARKGRIGAVKVGRKWMISKKALEEYLQEVG
jgi:excisionase family DNA binding protein